MLQFLCLQMCVYGGGVVPQGGVGDRHLVTIPQGVVGDRLPWGGERQGGGEGMTICLCHRGICELSIRYSWPKVPVAIMMGKGHQRRPNFKVHSKAS